MLKITVRDCFDNSKFNLVETCFGNSINFIYSMLSFKFWTTATPLHKKVLAGEKKMSLF